MCKWSNFEQEFRSILTFFKFLAKSCYCSLIVWSSETSKSWVHNWSWTLFYNTLHAHVCICTHNQKIHSIDWPLIAVIKMSWSAMISLGTMGSIILHLSTLGTDRKKGDLDSLRWTFSITHSNTMPSIWLDDFFTSLLETITLLWVDSVGMHGGWLQWPCLLSLLCGLCYIVIF